MMKQSNRNDAPGQGSLSKRMDEFTERTRSIDGSCSTLNLSFSSHQTTPLEKEEGGHLINYPLPSPTPISRRGSASMHSASSSDKAERLSKLVELGLRRIGSNRSLKSYQSLDRNENGCLLVDKQEIEEDELIGWVSDMGNDDLGEVKLATKQREEEEKKVCHGSSNSGNSNHNNMSLNSQESYLFDIHGSFTKAKSKKKSPKPLVATKGDLGKDDSFNKTTHRPPVDIIKISYKTNSPKRSSRGVRRTSSGSLVPDKLSNSKDVNDSFASLKQRRPAANAGSKPNKDKSTSMKRSGSKRNLLTKSKSETLLLPCKKDVKATTSEQGNEAPELFSKSSGAVAARLKKSASRRQLLQKSSSVKDFEQQFQVAQANAKKPSAKPPTPIRSNPTSPRVRKAKPTALVSPHSNKSKKSRSPEDILRRCHDRMSRRNIFVGDDGNTGPTNPSPSSLPRRSPLQI